MTTNPKNAAHASILPSYWNEAQKDEVGLLKLQFLMRNNNKMIPVLIQVWILKPMPKPMLQQQMLQPPMLQPPMLQSMLQPPLQQSIIVIYPVLTDTQFDRDSSLNLSIVPPSIIRNTYVSINALSLIFPLKHCSQPEKDVLIFKLSG